MEFDNHQIINDSLSERELQKLARMEMSIALDNYLKRKRKSGSTSLSCNDKSLTDEQKIASQKDSSSSVCSEKEDESVQQIGNEDECNLQEPLRTYDKALSSVLFDDQNE